MKLLFAFLTLFCWSDGSGPAPVAPEPAIADYFDVKVGTVRHFKQGEPKGEVSDVRLEVLSRCQKGDTIVSVNLVEVAGMKPQYYTMVIEKDTCIRAGFGKGAYCIGQTPLKVGTAWEGSEGSLTIMAVDQEVKMAAGAFKCLVLRTDTGTLLYFARGLELVRITVPVAQDGSGSGSETTEFVYLELTKVD